MWWLIHHEKLLLYIKAMKYKMIHVTTPKGEYVFTSVKEVSQFLGISTNMVYYYLKHEPKSYNPWRITPYYFESGKKVLPNNILAWFKNA